MALQFSIVPHQLPPRRGREKRREFNVFVSVAGRRWKLDPACGSAGQATEACREMGRALGQQEIEINQAPGGSWKELIGR